MVETKEIGFALPLFQLVEVQSNLPVNRYLGNVNGPEPEKK